MTVAANFHAHIRTRVMPSDKHKHSRCWTRKDVAGATVSKHGLLDVIGQQQHALAAPRPTCAQKLDKENDIVFPWNPSDGLPSNPTLAYTLLTIGSPYCTMTGLQDGSDHSDHTIASCVTTRHLDSATVPVQGGTKRTRLNAPKGTETRVSRADFVGRTALISCIS